MDINSSGTGGAGENKPIHDESEVGDDNVKISSRDHADSHLQP